MRKICGDCKSRFWPQFHSAAGMLVDGAALAGVASALDAGGGGGAGLSATAAFGVTNFKG
jgi:hypothetical protein